MEGHTDVWDIDLLKLELMTLKDGSKFDEEKAIVLRENSRSFLTHTALAISSRCEIAGDFLEVFFLHFN